jgi:MFS family permease
LARDSIPESSAAVEAVPARGALASPGAEASDGSLRLAGLGVLALAIMAPVTLPVPVLREVVQERFAVGELPTSVFMSINMLGALIAAPIAGALADRWGRRRLLLVLALLLDAACFAALAAPVGFPAFLSIRFVEGCAHITALSILLMLASHVFPSERRGRAMGVVGGCMMLGIALSATPVAVNTGPAFARSPARCGPIRA